MSKRRIGIDVLTASKGRISTVFDNFERIYISFSGGKDSSVMMHLVCEEARERGVKIGVLIVDLEAQYKLTILHINEIIAEYEDCIELYWVALPIVLRNAVSVYEPRWMCWEEGASWVREPDSKSITNIALFPFFKIGMEFEEFVPAFGNWYSQGASCACFVGIRCDESLNRYRTIANTKKQTFQGHQWTTKLKGMDVYNAYPLYDWSTADIWRYNGKFNRNYNRLYDLMSKAGLSIHQQRICQPYGDDQRKGLWLYHIIEPETWAKVVARVSGANSGSEFVQLSGNGSGQVKISKPDNHTWQSFSMMLLESMPNEMGEHYRNRIFVFLKWYAARGYPEGIPDELPVESKDAPSWRRVCKMLLRNDYWGKGLSFAQGKSGHIFELYKARIKRNRMEAKQLGKITI
jgi:predicted phosphoadenosine phosphosulfate sulfurtransferase